MRETVSRIRLCAPNLFCRHLSRNGPRSSEPLPKFAARVTAEQPWRRRDRDPSTLPGGLRTAVAGAPVVQQHEGRRHVARQVATYQPCF